MTHSVPPPSSPASKHPAAPWPTLNWKEIQLWVEKFRPQLEGLFVERIIVPERSEFPGGYLKGEWAIRLTGRKQEGILLCSIRPRHPYLVWKSGKGPLASQKATRSPFDLSVSKQLKGARLLQMETLPRERAVILWFSEEGQSDTRIGLVLLLIPATPEAFLVRSGATNGRQASGETPEKVREGWPILARSRTVRDESRQISVFTPPDGAQAPPNPPIRTEWVGLGEGRFSQEGEDPFFSVIENRLKEEAFEERYRRAEKGIQQQIKQARDRLAQSEMALKEGEREKDWRKLGDLLKASMWNLPPEGASVRRVTDFETGAEISIACDPKLNLKDQIEKFYHSARRKQRRIQEAQGRIERFQEVIQKLETALKRRPELGDWSVVESLERLSGIQPSESKPLSPVDKRASSWLGKSFVSKDGWTILVGRSKDENLELTFKVARGNDLWMHLRGRPGAHIVIPVQPGKSVPLETLLDAANLTLHYSGAANWGKTEVDYAFKKHVKRIKDSTEASYTHNKTLIVQIEPERIKRLLDQNG